MCSGDAKTVQFINLCVITTICRSMLAQKRLAQSWSTIKPIKGYRQNQRTRGELAS